jgi:hypothetical protein
VHITNQRIIAVMRDLGTEADVVAQSMPQDLMGQQTFAASFAVLEFSRAMAWIPVGGTTAFGSCDPRTGLIGLPCLCSRQRSTRLVRSSDAR